MDILTVEEGFKKLSFSAQTLNVDERFQIKLRLIKLKEEQKLAVIFFWGKINGIKKDYYIALGYIFNQKAEFPEKKFYFATNDYIFVELPEVEEQHIQYCQNFNSYFTGEHTNILVKVKQEVQKPGSMPLKDFRELHRLSYVVRKIEEDTHVVPEGAFKLTPIREVRKNSEFIGLDINDAFNIKKYYHYRQVQQPEKKNFIHREDAIMKPNFMDEIGEDKIKGSWSITKDMTGTTACIKSMLWPGYFAYCTAHTNMYGGVYMGYGLKSKDLPFLL